MHRFLVDCHLPWKLPLIGEYLRISSYSFMLAIGVLSGLWVAARRADRAGFKKEQIIDVGVFAVLWGVIGARLFHVLEHADYYFSKAGFLRMPAVWEGGLVYYGGLLCAIGYIAYHFLRRGDLGARLIPFLDLVAPSTSLGVAFTRIGCFLNGCCYGKPTHLPWGVKFLPVSPMNFDLQASSSWIHNNLRSHPFPVHPTQLYSMLLNLTLFGFLYWYWPRRRGNGEVAGLSLILYGILRFFVEFIRINPPIFSAIPLSFSQWVSIPAFLFGLYLFLGSRGWINSHWKSLRPLKDLPPMTEPTETTGFP